MDRNSPPTYTEASAEASVAATEEFIEGVARVGSPLVAPIVTPRFVPTCSSELMRALGRVARERGGLPVQTHVSENAGEIAWVAELHPEAEHYTDVYAAHGLLTERTLLAHGVHLSDAELAVIAKARAVVAHCPLSNFSLCSGVCPVRRLLAAGVRVSLGTDVSGGASASMLDAMKHAIIASQATFVANKAHGDPLSWKEALFLATVAGADALGIGDRTGRIAPGMEFDALFVDPAPACGGAFDLFGWESLEQTAEKFVMAGDDRNIVRVFVHGREVVPFAAPQQA